MEQEEAFLYHRIQEALENIPENFYILEEQIDVELQQEYFAFSSKLHGAKDFNNLIKNKERLFNPQERTGLKKKILAALGSSGEVEAFRTIERYLANPDQKLKDWAILALQEGRMMLQSALLDEQQVYISTGLGGKGKKLRYFVVFMNREGMLLSEMQAKLLRDELEYAMGKTDGELEEFTRMLDYTTAVVVLPLKAPLKTIFREIIDECNQYGEFLKEDMVITNVKRLNPLEIVELLKQQAEGEEDPEHFDPGTDGEDD